MTFCPNCSSLVEFNRKDQTEDYLYCPKCGLEESGSEFTEEEKEEIYYNEMEKALDENTKPDQSLVNIPF